MGKSTSVVTSTVNDYRAAAEAGAINVGGSGNTLAIENASAPDVIAASGRDLLAPFINAVQGVASSAISASREATGATVAAAREGVAAAQTGAQAAAALAAGREPATDWGKLAPWIVGGLLLYFVLKGGR